MPDAKLLTIEEALEADVFWYEDRYVPSVSEYGRARCGFTRNYIVISRIDRDRIHEDRRDYGYGWRCWNWKPTEEQRKNVNWLEYGDEDEGDMRNE